MTDYVIESKELTKTYQMGEIEVHALNGVSLQIERGDVVAIMGPSGSGKSTMMNIMGCLDRPSTGSYILDGQDVSNLKDDQLALIRNQSVGFVFQSFNLLPRISALHNVEMPLRYSQNGKNRQARSKEALELVGLGDRMNHLPTELSGGQQQRVAVARSLVNHPAIVMADEPTGALDTRTGEDIMELLLKLNRENGVTLIIVTHDPKVASYANHTIHILDGMIKENGS
jgi:putative ABC transport system ATP-binding protein